MEVDETEAIGLLAERNVVIGDPAYSALRLKALRRGEAMSFEAPIVMERLPGVFTRCGRHTEIEPCEFGLVGGVGSFTTIANDVIVGKAEHPTGFVSVHNLFYADRAPTGFAKKDQPFLAENRNAILDAGRKHNVRNRRATEIGDDVFIGSRAIISRGVRIGTGAIIGAGAVVAKDVAPYTIVGGVPARPIRRRFSEEAIAGLLASRWWERDFSLLRGIDLAEGEAAAGELTRRLERDPGRYDRKPEVFVLRRTDEGTLKLFKRKNLATA